MCIISEVYYIICTVYMVGIEDVRRVKLISPLVFGKTIKMVGHFSDIETIIILHFLIVYFEPPLQNLPILRSS